MAQSIKNLALGSKIQDSKGNKFIVIAKNQYASNEVTLLSEQSIAKLQMSPTPSQNTEYPNTEVTYYLNNDYLKTLDSQLQTAIKVTSLPYSDSISGSQFTDKTVYAKAPEMGKIWRDFGHAFSFASSSSRGMYPSPSYLIWMCCTRFPLDLSGAST